MPEEIVAQGRVVLTLLHNRLALRSEDGLLPIETALQANGFAAGDLVEVRLLERCPAFGTQQWLQASRRG